MARSRSSSAPALSGIRPSGHEQGRRFKQPLGKTEGSMKRVLIGAIAAAVGAWAGSALAADSVTLQLKWVTQAQFGGYYVAKEKGFYSDEGLDVTIKPGGPDIAPETVIAGGGADVI